MAAPLLLAKNESTALELLPALANRHVPVFMADVKGDLSGIAKAGGPARSVGSELGRQLLRGILGSVLGSSNKRRR